MVTFVMGAGGYLTELPSLRDCREALAGSILSKHVLGPPPAQGSLPAGTGLCSCAGGIQSQATTIAGNSASFSSCEESRRGAQKIAET